MTTMIYADDTARNWRLAPREDAIEDAMDRLDLEARLARSEGDKKLAKRLDKIADLLDNAFES